MERIVNYRNVFKKLSEDQIQKYSEELINILSNEILKESQHVKGYVDHLRRLNPLMSVEKLSQRIVTRRSLKASGIGAITNIGGIITMPVTMPMDLYLTFRVQARMVLAIAYLYEWDITDRDILTDVLLVMGGEGAMRALSGAGVKIGQEFAKKSVNKYINREIMKKINKVVSRKIITKAGEKSLTSFSKLVPVVGAPIGAGINWVGTQLVGRTAHKFYQG